jgi:glycosyltransferase involved in cell wall biosynthesis
MPGRVLVVTYHFPPVGGIGVQRTLKYVTYLRRSGWEPVVITPRDPAFPLRDPALLASVPQGIEVHRNLSLEPARATMLARRRVASGRKSRSTTAAEAPHSERRPSGRPSGLRRLARLGAKGWQNLWDTLLFPDQAVAWMPFAIRSGLQIHRRRPVDVLYSSAMPITTHLVAGALKARTGLPWVADFRDPWVESPILPNPRFPKRQMQRRTERWIVERADRVVLAMEGLREMFATRYPSMADKFVYIPNGYDLADFAGLEPIPSDPGRFNLLFAGSLYRHGELEAVLGGVELMAERRPDLRSRLLLRFLGRANEENKRIAAEYTAPGRIGDVVRFEDFVPRQEALAQMAGADALLQLRSAEPGSEMFVSGKVFEYMTLDRPILAVMPPGDGRRLVDGLPGGRSADVDPASVADALERLLDDPPVPGPSDVEGRYARVNLAAELAAVLDAAVEERAAKRLHRKGSRATDAG